MFTNGPVMVIRFGTQQIEAIRNMDGKVIEGDLVCCFMQCDQSNLLRNVCDIGLFI